jgi:hypothetical protein
LFVVEENVASLIQLVSPRLGLEMVAKVVFRDRERVAEAEGS